jgi:hypothetical protein
MNIFEIIMYAMIGYALYLVYLLVIDFMQPINNVDEEQKHTKQKTHNTKKYKPRKPWEDAALVYINELRIRAKQIDSAASSKRRWDLFLKIALALTVALNISSSSGSVSTALLYASLAAPSYWSTISNPLYLTILTALFTILKDTLSLATQALILSGAANDLRRIAKSIELLLQNDSILESQKLQQYEEKIQEVSRIESSINIAT